MGLAAAVLCPSVPAEAFKAIVPVLICVALVMVVLQPRLARWVAARQQARSGQGSGGRGADSPSCRSATIAVAATRLARETLPPTTNPTADAQDAMVLARQGLMEGIYRYMEDAEDWTEKSPGANDAAILQALTREAAHMALVLPALRQLFPPSTNPASPEFVSRFDTYALPVIWTEPDGFALTARLPAL